jgi:hypothetical protein
MNEILNKYQVQFSTPLNYCLYNEIITINDLMSQIIGDQYKLSSANALLNAINNVINGVVNELVYFTDSCNALIINNSLTKLYDSSDNYANDNSILPYYTLPTSDFQVIVQAWRDYLAQSATTPS